MRSAVVDVDGPLLDVSRRHYACYRTALSAAGGRPLPFERYWSAKRSRTDWTAILAMSQAGDMLEEFSDRWLDLIESETLLELDRPQPFVTDVLGQWRATGISVVATSLRRRPRTLRQQLQRLGLAADLADLVTASPAEGAAGKARAVVARMQGDLLRGCRAWIGDTEVDIEAARRAGVPSIAVACGVRDERALASARPDHICADLRDVAVRDVAGFGAPSSPE